MTPDSVTPTIVVSVTISSFGSAISPSPLHNVDQSEDWYHTVPLKNYVPRNVSLHPIRRSAKLALTVSVNGVMELQVSLKSYISVFPQYRVQSQINGPRLQNRVSWGIID